MMVHSRLSKYLLFSCMLYARKHCTVRAHCIPYMEVLPSSNERFISYKELERLMTHISCSLACFLFVAKSWNDLGKYLKGCFEAVRQNIEVKCV